MVYPNEDVRNYYKLNYIRSTGKQYIDTDCSITNEYRIYVEGNGYTNKEGRFFGTKHPDQALNCFYVMRVSDSDSKGKVIRFSYNNTNQYTNVTGAKLVDYDFTFDLNKNVFSLIYGSNQDTVSYTFPSRAFSTDSVIIFNAVSSIEKSAEYNLKTFVIYNEKGEIVRNLIPAVNHNTWQVGLYDLSSNAFYTEDIGQEPLISGDMSERIHLVQRSQNGGSIKMEKDDTPWPYTQSSENISPDGYAYFHVNALADPGYEFSGWYSDSEYKNLISKDAEFEIAVNTDGKTIYASFTPIVNISYDSTLGTVSSSYETENKVILSASSYEPSWFDGWYKDGVLLSSDEEYSYYPKETNETITAKFVKGYSLSVSSDGKGNVSFSRVPKSNNVTITSLHGANYHFVYLLVNNGTDTVYNDSVVTLNLTADSIAIAYFEEDNIFHLTTNTNISGLNVYLSANDVYAGTVVTLYARPMSGYEFSKWSDNVTDNPRYIAVNSHISLTAIYTHSILTENTLLQYRCYVKDQMLLTDEPKAFFRADSFTLKGDLLTTANSTIEVFESDKKELENIEKGDIIVIYDPFASTVYQGVIKSTEDLKISCSQMQSFYKGEWIYEKGETPPESYDNSWYYEQFEAIATTPHIDDFYGQTPTSTNTYNDDKCSISMNISNNYSAKCTTYVWCSIPVTFAIFFKMKDNGSVYVNDQLLGDFEASTEKGFTLDLVKGMNKVNVCYRNATGNDGWMMYLKAESFDLYNATKTYAIGDYVNYNNGSYQCTTAITEPEKWTSGHWKSVTNPKIVARAEVLGMNSTEATGIFLETNLKNLLTDYSLGKLVGSNYTDPQVARRLRGIDIFSIDSTAGVNLPSNPNGTTVDMEKFIYTWFDKYGIILDFNINFSGPNSVTVKVPTNEKIIIAENSHAIKDIKVNETVEETSRLVIFSSDNKYRSTWVVKPDGTQVEEPDSSVIDRFDLTNTEIVFSDDPISDLVAAYLPSIMYNHIITFTLLLNNYVYESSEFKLGTPLGIWDKDMNYYDSVLTGYEIQKNSGKNITQIKYTCGLVRQKLTQRLALGKV